jgi:hypothetical protein
MNSIRKLPPTQRSIRAIAIGFLTAIPGFLIFLRSIGFGYTGISQFFIIAAGILIAGFVAGIIARYQHMLHGALTGVLFSAYIFYVLMSPKWRPDNALLYSGLLGFIGGYIASLVEKKLSL